MWSTLTQLTFASLTSPVHDPYIHVLVDVHVGKPVEAPRHAYTKVWEVEIEHTENTYPMWYSLPPTAPCICKLKQPNHIRKSKEKPFGQKAKGQKSMLVFFLYMCDSRDDTQHFGKGVVRSCNQCGDLLSPPPPPPPPRWHHLTSCSWQDVFCDIINRGAQSEKSCTTCRLLVILSMIRR